MSFSVVAGELFPSVQKGVGVGSFRGPTSTSYLELLASYSLSSKKDGFTVAYNRNSKVFWGSKGFLEFILSDGAQDFGADLLKGLVSCGSKYGRQVNKKDGSKRYYPRGCGNTVLCGRCASAKSKQRAFNSFEVFRELIKAVRKRGLELECMGLDIELTMPIWLSEYFCSLKNRGLLRDWVDRLFKVSRLTIEKWLCTVIGIEKMKIGGTQVLHWWKSGAPWKPHVHFHFLIAPVFVDTNGDIKPLKRWYEKEEIQVLRDIWKRELGREFGELAEILNVHVNYLRNIKKTVKEKKGKAEKAYSLEFKCEYNTRSPVKDFAKCIKASRGGMFEVEVIPEKAMSNRERVKGIVPYSELKNFIDLIDAFSVGRKIDKFKNDINASMKSKIERNNAYGRRLNKMSVFEMWEYEKANDELKDFFDRIKRSNPDCYNTITKKTSKKIDMKGGRLERIRWFGFLAKRNLSNFFDGIDVGKKEVSSDWEDTGEEFIHVRNTDNGVEVVDVETGEVLEIPSILICGEASNIGGKKWIWSWRGRGSSP